MMLNRGERITVIKNALANRTNLKVQIEGESFSTHLLHFDEPAERFIADDLIPKYGNNFLKPGQTYNFSESEYENGEIDIIEFTTVYIETNKFEGSSAHIFSLPIRVESKKIIFEIKPKLNETITISFNIGLNKITEKVINLSIRNAYFHCFTTFPVPESGMKMNRAVIKLQNEELGVDGKIFRDAKYDYRLEFETLNIEVFSVLNSYLIERYQEAIGLTPIRVERPKVQRPTIRPSQTQPIKGKVFIVDDEILVTDLLSKVLRLNGFQCYAFNNGLKLCETAVKFKPDLILLDIKMPDLDGHTILRRLKRNAETKRIPVVMLSSSRDRDDVFDALQSGASSYIIKSADMNFEDLLKKIELIIRGEK